MLNWSSHVVATYFMYEISCFFIDNKKLYVKIIMKWVNL